MFRSALILLVLYGGCLILAAYTLPVAVTAILGGLAVVMASLHWGFQGGAAFSILTSTVLIGCDFLLGWDLRYYELGGGILLYLVTGFSTGRAISLTRWQKQRLDDSLERLDLALWGSRQGLWDWNIKTGEIYRDDRYLEMMGYSREELPPTRKAWQELVYPEDLEKLESVLSECLSGKRPLFEAEYRIKNKNGSWSWLLDRGRVSEWDEDGHPSRIVGTSQDIGLQKRMAEDLKESEETYRDLFENCPVGLITCDRSGRIKEINGKMLDIVEKVTGHRTSDFNLFHTQLENDTESARETLERVFATKSPVEKVYRLKSKVGKSVWVRVKVYPTFDLAHNVHQVIISGEDITELKEVEAETRYLNYHDQVTGLYNRGYFERKMEEIDHSGLLPISIICGDVNGLKLINDAFGREAGDQLLINVAKVLRSSCRKTDIIARWGGDEFACLLPATDADAAELICDQIRAACAAIESGPIAPSLALGAATKVDAAYDLALVLKQAEERMLRNKLVESTSARSAIILSLTRTLHEKSNETEEHAERMKELAVALGMRLGMHASDLDALTVMAALHDIGKLAIPEDILDKEDRLSPEEWEKVKCHPEIGYRIAQSSADLAPIAEAIWAHHERWDAKGYPRGLKGKEIPLFARIIAIVDAYDVMVHGRPYKGPMAHVEALAELERCAGTQFDPDLVKIFVEMIVEREKLQVPVGASLT